MSVPKAGVESSKSLVLSTGYPDEFHTTIDDVTMDGFQPGNCDALLLKFCDPPVEEVCANRKWQINCEKGVKRVCAVLDRLCQYRFCGPVWFPYDEPAPDKAGCEWWDHIRKCPPKRGK